MQLGLRNNEFTYHGLSSVIYRRQKKTHIKINAQCQAGSNVSSTLFFPTWFSFCRVSGVEEGGAGGAAAPLLSGVFHTPVVPVIPFSCMSIACPPPPFSMLLPL